VSGACLLLGGECCGEVLGQLCEVVEQGDINGAELAAFRVARGLA
jgi:hypothetical protein